MLALLKRLRDEYQLAIVLITHEMDAVRTAADAVAEIRDGTTSSTGGSKICWRVPILCSASSCCR